ESGTREPDRSRPHVSRGSPRRRPERNRLRCGCLMDLSKDNDPPERDDRLTTLETNWTKLREAHLPGPTGQKAMSELISRYHDAVQRYLRLKIRDRNLADDVFQDFWTKLADHKLAGADQSKGRFRDYLRTVLHRLIIDHYRGRKLQPLPP